MASRFANRRKTGIWLTNRMAARTGTRALIPSPSPLTPVASIEGGTNYPKGTSYLDHLYGLSILLARVLGVVYSREGLAAASNKDLIRMRDELREWKDGVPAGLRLTNLASSVQAGLLHLLHTTTVFILYRPFMRWSFHVDR